MRAGSPVYACNAGIFGGTNASFFREYAATAFEYIHKNADKLKHINVNSFNVFFEQHLFYALAKEKNIPINVLFEGINDDKGYKYLGDFQDDPFNRSYLHLLGEFKRDEFTCILMAAKLRELYPNHYDRILALFHEKNIRLSPCGFTNSHIRRNTNGSNPATNQIDEQNNTHLKRLKLAAKHCPPNITKALFQNAFNLFYMQLTSLLTTKVYPIEDLNNRDLSARFWYRNLFSEPSTVLNHVIVRCQEFEIIESPFNWAGLFNKFYRAGSDYYAKLQITKGHFLNLVVFEATDNGFSLYDINRVDHTILQILSEPLSVKDVIIKMQVYFDDDVWQNHYEDYEKLLFTSMKNLVIKKAIKPS